MPMEGQKTVWVHAWRTDLSAGFDWYHDREPALAAYEADEPQDGYVKVFTPYVTEANESAQETTDAIDSEIDAILRDAAIRDDRYFPTLE